MLTRLSVHVGRKLLNGSTSFQKVAECHFSQLVHNNINNALRRSLLFNNHEYSKVYGVCLLRYNSTVNTPVTEAVAKSTTEATANVAPSSPIVETPKVDTVTSAVTDKDLLNEIPEPPIPISEELIEAIQLQANGDPTFTSLGLGGYGPVGLIQYYFEWLHVSCHLPWWATVVVTSLIIKLLTFPFMIDTHKNAIRMQNVMPGMVHIQEKLTIAKNSGNIEEASLRSYELQTFLQKNKVKLLQTSQFLMIGVHLPIFMALRGMANTDVPSLKEGGLWWFSDLTVPDPYYILPCFTTITMFIVTENAMKSAATSSMSPVVLYFMRGLPLVSFLFAMKFPGLVLCHWATSNISTILQNRILKVERVKKFLDFPVLVKHPKNLLKDLKKSQKGFRESFNESWSNMKLSNRLAAQARADMIQFNEAGKAPLKRTYKYNPKAQAQALSAMKKQ